MAASDTVCSDVQFSCKLRAPSSFFDFGSDDDLLSNTQPHCCFDASPSSKLRAPDSMFDFGSDDDLLDNTTAQRTCRSRDHCHSSAESSESEHGSGSTTSEMSLVKEGQMANGREEVAIPRSTDVQPSVRRLFQQAQKRSLRRSKAASGKWMRQLFSANSGSSVHEESSEESSPASSSCASPRVIFSANHSHSVLIERLLTRERDMEMLTQIQCITSLCLKSLRYRYSKAGFPLEPDLEKGELVRRLIDDLLWRNMAVQELVRECDRCNVSTSGLSQVHTEVEQLRLLTQRLREHMCMNAWSAKGIPVARFGSFEVATVVVSRCAQYERMKTQDLKEEYKSLGLPVEPDLERSSMLRRLRTVAFWMGLSAKELKKDCEDRKLETKGVSSNENDGQERHRLLQLLLASMCTDFCSRKGIPLHRLSVVSSAARLAEQWDRLERLSIASLKVECVNVGCEVGIHDGVDEAEILVGRLKCVYLWRELPLTELKIECRNRRVPVESLRRGSSEVEHCRELVGKLLASLDAGRYERQGIPVQRLGSNAIAEKLAKELNQLESMNPAELSGQYGHLGLPWAVDVERDIFVRHLRQILIWNNYPVTELRKDCQDRGVAMGGKACWGDDAELRRTLVQRLILDICGDAYEATGIPAKRLGSLDAALRLRYHFSAFEEMSLPMLQAHYVKLGAHPDDKISQNECLARLRDACIWQELPTVELQAECRERGVSMASNRSSDAEQRRHMIDRLFISIFGEAYKTHGIPIHELGSVTLAARVASKFALLGAMSHEVLVTELSTWDTSSATLDRAELIKRQKQIIVWMALPLVELRTQCRTQRLPFSGSDDRNELVKRLSSASWGSTEEQPSQGHGRRRIPPQGCSQHTIPANIAQHFLTLQVPPTANATEVGKAFRRLALQFHPDKNSGVRLEQASEDFRAIAEAYEALTDYLKPSEVLKPSGE